MNLKKAPVFICSTYSILIYFFLCKFCYIFLVELSLLFHFLYFFGIFHKVLLWLGHLGNFEPDYVFFLNVNLRKVRNNTVCGPAKPGRRGLEGISSPKCIINGPAENNIQERATNLNEAQAHDNVKQRSLEELNFLHDHRHASFLVNCLSQVIVGFIQGIQRDVLK